MLRIKEVCKAKKTSIAVLAKKIGISRTALGYSINGNPKYSTLERIAVELECTVIELIHPENGFTHVYDENGNYAGVVRV